MNDYISRFGLEFNPFLKNAKEVIIDTAESAETATRLSYLGDIKGFGFLTGSPGVEKRRLYVNGQGD